ncbi:MAG: hypothetical protein ACP5O5_04210 [Fervidicoccaceae archaeon]
MKVVERGRWRKELLGSYVESLVVSKYLENMPAFLGVKLTTEDSGVAFVYKGTRLHYLMTRGLFRGENLFLNFTHSSEVLIRAFIGEEVKVNWNEFPPRIEGAHLIVRASVEKHDSGDPIKVYLKLYEEWVDESSVFPLTRVTGLVTEALIELSRLGIGDSENRERSLNFFKERLIRVSGREELLELLKKAEEEARSKWKG